MSLDQQRGLDVREGLGLTFSSVSLSGSTVTVSVWVSFSDAEHVAKATLCQALKSEAPTVDHSNADLF